MTNVNIAIRPIRFRDENIDVDDVDDHDSLLLVRLLVGDRS